VKSGATTGVLAAINAYDLTSISCATGVWTGTGAGTGIGVGGL